MHTTHSNTQYNNQSKHSEMGPVRQNPIQRTVSLFICVFIALCTIVAHNIAQNRPDSFPPYPPAGVPQTNEMISATSRPKFTILWRHLEHILLLNKFFPIVDTCLSCKDIAHWSCAMVPRWRFLATFLRPVFAASREQHISDLHSKFALGPRHV